MYGGAFVFVAHFLNNKFRIQKSTALFAIAPYVLQITAQIVGNYYVDYTLSTRNIYNKYEIYD